jgi:hypothetical protein
MLASLVILAAIALPWYGLVWRWEKTNNAAAQAIADEARALLAETRHPGSILYYLYTLPARLLPWSLALPPALMLAWRHRSRAPMRLLLCWFAVTLAVLTATPSKQGHYVWLLLTPTALFLGAFLHRWSKILLPVGLVALLAFAGWCLARAWSSSDYSTFGERLIAKARTTTEASPMIHVWGTNSAIFDFYLGRHVHNAESAEAAWMRARPGEAVVLYWEKPDPDSRKFFERRGLASDQPRLFHALKPPRKSP